jgi:uncharacterized protein YndB with AHSA1/START domain
MPFRVCPIGEVAASAAHVWSFLQSPRHLDQWWDAKVLRAEPDGPLEPGQRIEAVTREIGITFKVWFHVDEVEPAEHRLRLAVHLPFGIINHAAITVTQLGPAVSRLTFG